MKKKITRGLAMAAAAAALTVGLASPAGAVPPGFWSLESQTPISSGYMYTYRNAGGGYFVSANYHGTWFTTYNVR